MEQGHDFIQSFLLNGAVLLGLSVLFVLPFRRLGLGAVLGYLIAGLVAGQFLLPLAGEAESMMSFTEIGIVLLLFLVGLELSPRRLWLMRHDIFLLGPAQVILCGLAMFGVILLWMGFTWQAALVIGMPLGLSSTAQVLPMLQSGGRLATKYGQKSFAILLFQDLSIVPLLTLVAALSRAPATGQASGLILVLYALGAIILLALAGRFILLPVLRLVGVVAERELFMVTGLAAVCASAALMQSLGLSAALGAFVAGVVLAESPYRHELEADIDPFRSLLLGLFFISVGMSLDVNVILNNPIMVIAMALALVAVKALIIWLIAPFAGLKGRNAVGMALLLSQGGEFGFVLFNAANSALLIEKEASSFFSAVITLSMATTPFLMMLAKKLRSDAPADGELDANLIDPEHAEQASVIIVGHGRFGQVVAQIMEGAGNSITVIDIKPEQIDRSSNFGRKVFYGDGTRLDLLRRAGAEDARAILFCIDDHALDAATLAPVAHAFPQAKLFARAYDRRQLMRLQGVEGLISLRELYGSSVRMAAETLRAIGFEQPMVRAIVRDFHDRDLRRLAEQTDSGDLKAGMELVYGANFIPEDEKMDEWIDKGDRPQV